MQHPNPHEPGWELWLYRRRRRGDTLTEAENKHLDSLAPWYARFEEMAKQHDERDRAFRAEIAKHPEGYGWHKSLGQLPFDWCDSELARLRPRDWKQVREIRFVRVTSARTPKQRRSSVRPRERRPVRRRRTSSSSSTSSADPPDEPAPARLLVRRPSGATAVFRASSCVCSGGRLEVVGEWADLPGVRVKSFRNRDVLDLTWLELVA